MYTMHSNVNFIFTMFFVLLIPFILMFKSSNNNNDELSKAIEKLESIKASPMKQKITLDNIPFSMPTEGLPIGQTNMKKKILNSFQNVLLLIVAISLVAIALKIYNIL